MFDQEAEGLRKRLSASAGQHAHSAFQCFRDGDGLGFYSRAGTALELAIKARICQHNVAFLAPSSSGWFDDLVNLIRNPDGVGKAAPRTVDARRALSRLRELEPAFNEAFDLNVQQTIDRWNTAKHFGISSSPPADELVQHAASFVRAIAELLRKPFELFWGEHAAVAQVMLDEQVTEIRVRVAERIDEARRRFGAYPLAEQGERRPLARDEFFASGDVVSQILLDCPACASLGIASGEPFDNGTADHGGGPDDSYTWSAQPALRLETFECLACGLELHSPDEMAVAGFDAWLDNDAVGDAEWDDYVAAGAADWAEPFS